MKNKKGNSGKERNIWKMVSVVFIALFILILAWGLMNTRPRPTFTEPTQEQIDTAKAIVAQDLKARGDSISNYEVFVTNRIVGLFDRLHQWNEEPPINQIKPGDFRNIQVSLEKDNSTSHLYIVNIDSGKILMHSFTEWFNG